MRDFSNYNLYCDHDNPSTLTCLKPETYQCSICKLLIHRKKMYQSAQKHNVQQTFFNTDIDGIYRQELEKCGLCGNFRKNHTQFQHSFKSICELASTFVKPPTADDIVGYDNCFITKSACKYESA